MFLAPDDDLLTATLSSTGTGLFYRALGESGLRLLSLPLTGGVPRELLSAARAPNLPPGDLTELVASPDGRYLATLVKTPSASNETTLMIVPTDTGPPRALFTTRDASLSLLMWAPDSESVIVRRSGGSSEVLRIPTTGAAPALVSWPFPTNAKGFRAQPGGQRLVYVLNAPVATSAVKVITNLIPGPGKTR